jgi:hypothetical protein
MILTIILNTILLLWTPAPVELWTGIIDSTRAISWTAAGATIVDRTTHCADLTATATADTINQAIAGCTNNGVVYLAAGTYTLAGGLVAKEGVTLRGAGPHQTILVFTDGVGCSGYWATICVAPGTRYHIGGSWGPPSAPLIPGGSHTHSWTAGYTQGATDITLDDTTGLSAGMEIILDQKSDLTDTGEWVVGDAVGVLSIEGVAPGRWLNGAARSQHQYVTVSSIKGNVVTISPGLYASNWDAAKDPGVFWVDWITGFGIENLTIDGLNSGVSYNIDFYNATNCWVKNVRLLRNTTRNDINMYIASHITVQNSYFWGSATATMAYGIEGFYTGENLFANNILERMLAPIVLGSSVGNVLSHNYSIYHPDGSNVTAHTFWMHDTGGMFNLFEGNQCDGIRADDFHGPHQANTHFRNRFWGTGDVGDISYDTPFKIEALHRYYNYVGNVLGTAGYHDDASDLYEAYPPTAHPSNSVDLIYDLGYGGSPIPNDTLVRSTMMRWGNYDVKSAAVRWEETEVPSGLKKYANAVPGDHVLPNSFYLAAAPAYWTNPFAVVPWPAIGPDVTSGTGPGGFSYDIPSKLCYDNTGVDTTDRYKAYSLLLFDGGSCYGAATSPPDTTAPVVAITSPTSDPGYSVYALNISIGGTASDAVGVTHVTWQVNSGGAAGGFGTATGTTTWTVSNINLQIANTNLITVKAWDAAGNSSTDTLTVTRLDPPAGSSGGIRLRIKK